MNSVNFLIESRQMSIVKKFYLIVLLFSYFINLLATVLDNGVIGDPKVDCMEDRVRLTFRTEKPFKGRIFVKGMIENDKCVNDYATNSNQVVDFQLINGQCNMRRSRKLGPDQRGVEQSITVIISFHNVFITKIDHAYRCTCFYMEADKVVTNRFDVSMIPTTELIDTARMPLCTYSVRRGSVNGPVVTYATVGEPVFHVWNCDSDMFSMLVHNCFVDDGAGKDRKPLLDEHGCTIDSSIVSDLTYNNEANLAYSEVSVFKFADKITTYFQCAVSTCMISEGMCKGKTPPRCGVNSRRRRTIKNHSFKEIQDNVENFSFHSNASKLIKNKASTSFFPDNYVMDLAAEKIVVLDLADSSAAADAIAPGNAPNFDANLQLKSINAFNRKMESKKYLTEKRHDEIDYENVLRQQNKNEGIRESRNYYSVTQNERVCFSYHVISLLSYAVAFSVVIALVTVAVFLWRQRSSNLVKLCSGFKTYF